MGSGEAIDAWKCCIGLWRCWLSMTLEVGEAVEGSRDAVYGSNDAVDDSERAVDGSEDAVWAVEDSGRAVDSSGNDSGGVHYRGPGSGHGNAVDDSGS